MAVEGSITIGIGANTDKFDKQIAELEKRMKKEEKKGIKKEADITDLEKSINEYDTAQKEVERLTAKLEELREVRQGIMQQGDFSFVTPQGTVDFSNEYKDVEREIQKANTDLVKQTEIINSQGGSIDKNRAKLESMKQQHDEISQKVSEYKQKIESVKLQQQTAQIDKMKESFNSVGSSIQSTVKHVARLALGVFGIRSAFMFLRQASSSLAGYDKQYATNLEYIRYALTQAIAPVLQWIVRLAATLLGYINAIMQGWFGINLFSRGSAENFSKMKNKASGISKAVKQIKKDLAGFDEINKLTDQSDTGTSAGAVGVGMPNFDLSAMQGEPPAWLQWIIDNKDLILSTLAGIAAGLVFLKLGELAKNLGLIKGEMLGIKALGFGVMVAGIIYTIQSLLDYLKDPSWENFGKVIQGIGIAIVGLGILIVNVPLIVAGAIVLILGLLAKNWDKIREGFNKAIDWIKGLGDKACQWFFSNIDTIKEKFGWLGVGITAVFVGALDWITKLVAGIVEVIRDLLDGLFKGTKQILDGIIQIFRGDFKSGIISILKGIANLIIGVLNGLISGINAIIYPARAIIAGLGSVMGKSWTVNSVKIPKIPHLKTGGIINMPNKGTMLGSAIGGESGREGVLPLTDQQAMSELGREIGRHVLVNLTNITTMNGRVIGRELKQVQSEQEFAFNA